jgi:hypothetical protein
VFPVFVKRKGTGPESLRAARAGLRAAAAKKLRELTVLELSAPRREDAWDEIFERVWSVAAAAEAAAFCRERGIGAIVTSYAADPVFKSEIELSIERAWDHRIEVNAD